MYSKCSFTTSNQTLDIIINHLLTSRKPNKFDNMIVAKTLLMLYFTGMRPCECYELNKSDIDLIKREISINKEIGSNLRENMLYDNVKLNNLIGSSLFPMHCMI